jgi:cytoskeletal protein RodZ
MSSEIGQQLRQAREARRLSLEQAAQATRMKAHYLGALEAGDLAVLPSQAQARGFLRAYAEFLGLDPAPLLVELNGPLPASTPAATQPVAAAAYRTEVASRSSPSSDFDAQIFVDIGQRLKSQRELLGLSLDDVERHTRLRRHYLKALEDGKLQDLPSPVQGRGMLSNYAVFLGIDPEPLLLRFAEGLQARLTVRQAVEPEPSTRPARRRRPLPAPLRRLLSPDILIGVTFAIFLIVFVVWGAIRIFALRSDQQPDSTAPSIADVLLATETPTLDLATPGVISPTPSPQLAIILPAGVESGTTPEAGSGTGQAIILPTGEAVGVQVYVTVQQRAWMRAIVDGKVEFEGRVLPGSAYPFVGEEVVEILTSNGAGLWIFYNSQDLGPMGAVGEIVNRIYTPAGALAPTPTVTRTPTPTERVAATATPLPSTVQPTSPVLP